MHRFFVLTSEYLEINQTEAAKLCGLTTPTFSKRWREATNGKRNWPFRKVQKYKNEVLTCLMNIPCGPTPVSDDALLTLQCLMKLINYNLSPVTIRLS